MLQSTLFYHTGMIKRGTTMSNMLVHIYGYEISIIMKHVLTQ